MSDVETDGNDPKFSEIEYKPVRGFWPKEASNFTPWLLENSDYLAKALGIDLELELSEYPIGTFRLDLFGSDITHACPLVVENQLDKSNHLHLGQLLTYAAGTDAKTVVWISSEFCDEHRQALEYLNDLTGDNARFFGIEIKVAVIADSPPAPIFYLVVQPSDWRSQVNAERASTPESSRKVAYRSFWSQYLERIHEEHPGLTNMRSPQAAQWMTLNPLGKGTSISLVFLGNNKLSCELYINNRNGEKNMAIFSALHHQKLEIETGLGTELLWESMDGKQACRLRLEHDGSIKDESSWPEFIEWFLKWNAAFKQVLEPAVKALDESLWENTVASE